MYTMYNVNEQKGFLNNSKTKIPIRIHIYKYNDRIPLRLSMKLLSRYLKKQETDANIRDSYSYFTV